ncbi:MAG: 5-oxoprolinase subunit PxpB [Oscillochloridaceae bacterium umkhey_bin13]
MQNLPPEPITWTLAPLGEGGLLLRGEPVSPLVNRYALALAEALLAQPLPGLLSAVPAVNSLLVTFDPLRLDGALLATEVQALLATVAPAPAEPSRVVTIMVQYGGSAGPDLDEVAEHLGMTPAQIMRRLEQTVLRVLMIGFAPGFPYLGPLPPELHLPRRATPRTAVPPGSVAIAAGMAGIYPARLPGGWHLLGRTEQILFEPTREPPTLLQPGDGVRFVPINQ